MVVSQGKRAANARAWISIGVRDSASGFWIDKHSTGTPAAGTRSAAAASSSRRAAPRRSSPARHASCVSTSARRPQPRSTRSARKAGHGARAGGDLGRSATVTASSSVAGRMETRTSAPDAPEHSTHPCTCRSRAGCRPRPAEGDGVATRPPHFVGEHAERQDVYGRVRRFQQRSAARRRERARRSRY